MVRSSTAKTLSQIRPKYGSNYILKPSGATGERTNLLQGGRKGEPAIKSGRKAKKQSTVLSPGSWVKKPNKKTQGSRFRTGRLKILGCRSLPEL